MTDMRVVVVTALAATVLLGLLLFPKKIKGNGDSMIYHLPGCSSYSSVSLTNHPRDRMFFAERSAQSAGFRKAKNCPE